MKKLYSFRADVHLLDALRNEADERGVTVTDLIHDFLYESLERIGKQPVGDSDDFDAAAKMLPTASEDSITVEALNKILQRQPTDIPSLSSIGEVIESKFQTLKGDLKAEILNEIRMSIENDDNVSNLNQSK